MKFYIILLFSTPTIKKHTHTKTILATCRRRSGRLICPNQTRRSNFNKSKFFKRAPTVFKQLNPTHRHTPTRFWLALPLVYHHQRYPVWGESKHIPPLPPTFAANEKIKLAVILKLNHLIQLKVFKYRSVAYRLDNFTHSVTVLQVQ